MGLIGIKATLTVTLTT